VQILILQKPFISKKLQSTMPKISVDKDTCIGCGLCENICPKSFKMQDGKAEAINSTVDKITCEKEAEESCPVDSIKIS